MIRPNRFGTAVSTLALVAVLAGCAVNQQSRQSFASKADVSKVGLALRAQGALTAGQFASAVDLAEQAVQYTPNDAGFRKLLGNCYFAAGRFASAEQAYRDSLTLAAAQPDVVLKLALVEIGQGRNSDAIAALNAARGALDPADYGLAMALAGQPAEAVAVLNQVARTNSADARVRQNLALAYGLSGDWPMARTVAAQDLPPDQLDSRIQSWMQIATPAHPYDQLAMLTGVHPSADPGQPQQLALRSLQDNQAYAQLALPKTQAATVQAQAQPMPQPQPQQLAEIPATPPVALPDPAPAPAQEIAEADAPAPAVTRTLLQPALPAAAKADSPIVEAAAPALPTRFEAKPDPVKYVAVTDAVRTAAEMLHHARGHSSSVVQLGAYSSPERVGTAWSWMTKHFPALAAYTPVKARFDGPSGTVWRLSIKGFSSDGEARDRCEQLQSRGGKCFVRHVAGDSPVQFASR
jgi:D-alanyl-D-alanine carboxypeptidase